MVCQVHWWCVSGALVVCVSHCSHLVPFNLARNPPFVRYGQSTNTVCEQFNSVVLKMRELGLGALNRHHYHHIASVGTT